MDVLWDGVTVADQYQDWVQAARNGIADAAKSSDWPRLFQILSEHRGYVNSPRLGASSLFAPLHHAAYNDAPQEVIQQLIGLGAWRTLQNARGERPVDVAERRGFPHLIEVLSPNLKHHVPAGVLLKIQAHFHAVIHERIDEGLPRHALRLPELEPLLELDKPKMWFAVPGMYGGFSYWLSRTGADAILTAESWCRIDDGSFQRHRISSLGSRLVKQGF